MVNSLLRNGSLWLALSLSPSFLVARTLAWPEFRGPTTQGVSIATNLPVRWSATDNILWKTAVPGAGWSSPVIDENTIYLTTAVTNSGVDQLLLQVHAYDLKSGANLWITDALIPSGSDLARGHQKNTPASPTPVVRDGVIYAHFGHLGTAAVTRDGKVKWRQTSLGYSPVHGNGGSPALVGNTLVFSCDGAREPMVAGLDVETGKVKWQTPRKTHAKKTFSFATPAVRRIGNSMEVIVPGSGFVAGYHPETGAENWRVRYGEGYSVVPRPLVAQNHLFVGTGFDKANVMAIRLEGLKGDSTESHVSWTIQKGAPHTPSMILDGSEIYFVSDAGIASCADAHTGKVHWSERLGGDFSASPILAERRIYFFNESGEGTLVAPEKEFRILQRNELGDRTFASPAAVDGSLIVRSEHSLWRIGK